MLQFSIHSLNRRKKTQNYHFFPIVVYLDIGANLTDGMFQGIYNGSQKHPNDLDIILERSWNSGLDKIIITVGTITDTDDAVNIAKKDGISHLIFRQL